MKKQLIIPALALAIISSACKKDKDNVVTPNDPNEAEMISTVLLTVTNQNGNIATGLWKDKDGDGMPNIVDTLMLVPNTPYNGELFLLDEMKTPMDTISHEVEEEAESHQVFYTVNGVNININVSDLDENGVPLGLHTEINTSGPGKGSIRIILKHQPDEKPKSGNGNASVGATDVDILLPVVIK